MNAFIDPRLNPTPESTAVEPRTAEDPDALKDLLQLCREGRLYDVERWIQRERPLQLGPNHVPSLRHSTTALGIALRAGNHALVQLLLSNGCDPNLEQESPLNVALRSRRTDLLDLLLDWGADPHKVDPDALFGTYSTKLLERMAWASI